MKNGLQSSLSSTQAICKKKIQTHTSSNYKEVSLKSIPKNKTMINKYNLHSTYALNDHAIESAGLRIF